MKGPALPIGAGVSWVAGLALALGGLVQAQAASFPCERATGRVEQLICRSPEVSELDEHLGRYYAGAQAGFRHAKACLLSDQRAWLRTVRDACLDADCLRRVYLERLAVLHAVQPGVTSLRTMALPPVPPLVWIIGPASDSVAAPRERPTRPLVAKGRILDEVVSGDGFVLQVASGRKIVIQSSMLLEQPTSDALAGLARLPGAAYELRGRVDTQDREAVAFAAGQCTLVYRTTP